MAGTGRTGHPTGARAANEAVRWAQTLGEVAAFREQFGVLPGRGTRVPREDLLRQWVCRQRARERSGLLSPDQVQALERVDGDWRINRSGLSWEDKLTAAVLEYRESGDVPGPDVETGAWLQRQRSRMSAGKLSPDQLRALDGSIPGWRNLDRITWSRHARSLALLVQRTGSLPTSRSTEPGEVKLYTWLARQRKLCRAGKLEDARAAELDGIHPGWRGRKHPVVSDTALSGHI